MENEMENELDSLFSIEGNFDLIKATDNITFSNILDVGLGKGGASLYFALRGKKVTSLGLAISSYDMDERVLNNKNISIQETSFETYNSQNKFDAILLSHVLEHTQNVGLFLEKAHSLLSNNGWLFVMVPPYKNYIVGGHVSSGWNMGQLIYNLLLSGFDVKNGHFITYGYNICAFVSKRNQPLPQLRMDNGDLELLQDFMPTSLVQNTYAQIESINWFKNFNPLAHKSPSILNDEYKCVLEIYKFCTNLDKNKSYILYGYGSVGKLIYPIIEDLIIGIYDTNICSAPEDKRIKFERINSKSNVIITPFKYNNEIYAKLESIGCTILKVYPPK